jgi:hypothetical protein
MWRPYRAGGDIWNPKDGEWFFFLFHDASSDDESRQSTSEFETDSPAYSPVSSPAYEIEEDYEVEYGDPENCEYVCNICGETDRWTEGSFPPVALTICLCNLALCTDCLEHRHKCETAVF